MKHTETGMIPDDWEVKKIEDFAEVATGNKNTQDAEENGKYPFYVRSPIVEKINSFSFDSEGVITVGDGVGTGKVFHYAKGKFGLHQRAYLIHKFEKVDPLYFYYNFSQNFYKRVHAMTAKTSVDSVRREMITEMLVPLPPTMEEQQKIAKVLGNIDNTINALEKLIEKKKNIKQAAMQHLLTPKSDWETKKLGEILKIGHGRDYKHLKEGDIPVFGTGGYMTSVNEFLYDGETVCIGRKGTIDKPFYHKGKIWTVDTLFYTYNFQNVLPKYIYYVFCTIDWLSMNEASGVPSLTAKHIEEVLISIPCIKEQTSIAGILSGMDSEISALEQKLSKYKNLKAAMASQLLTGRIRLV